MFKPIEVRALPDYRLYVRYDNGVEGEVDLSHLVGKGVFAAWNDPGNFQKVSIGNSGEIRWNDQIDLCPDSIYMRISGKSQEEVFPNLSEATTNA